MYLSDDPYSPFFKILEKINLSSFQNIPILAFVSVVSSLYEFKFVKFNPH